MNSALVLLAAAFLSQPPQVAKPLPDWTAKCIAHGNVDSRAVALTFDDGPNPDTTPDSNPSASG